MKTKLLSIVIVLILVSNLSCINKQKSNKTEAESSNQEELKKSNNSAQILIAYQNAFGGEVSNYPSYYGGSFIDDDDNPVILTTDMTKEETIKKIVGSDNVIVKQCVYSYLDLLGLYERIKEVIKNDRSLADEMIVSQKVCKYLLFS
ncbi:MAG: hypothetical protein KH111_03995 [Bacteroidales bacterium]|nr:hypothetical protein [Bacteroidales bacterium]